MKYIRILTVYLIMSSAISPALAANCATSCTSKTVMSTLISSSISAINPDDMSAMVNCHKDLSAKEATSIYPTDGQHDKSDSHHQSCSMTGCHFSQATPADTLFKHVFIAAISVSFPSFDSTEKSIDLSPPLKPPA